MTDERTYPYSISDAKWIRGRKGFLVQVRPGDGPPGYVYFYTYCPECGVVCPIQKSAAPAMKWLAEHLENPPEESHG